jgi:hypothetical protein
MKNQKQAVLEYLQEGNILTRMIAMEQMGIMNVTARIAELRNEGYLIEADLITSVNRYGDKVSSAEWSLKGYTEPNQLEFEL